LFKFNIKREQNSKNLRQCLQIALNRSIFPRPDAVGIDSPALHETLLVQPEISGRLFQNFSSWRLTAFFVILMNTSGGIGF